jgi:hypothetical protein
VFCQAKCPDDPYRGSNELQALGFVANTAIASGERQRVPDVFGRGRNIEQQSHFAWISLLSEVQSEFTIPERLQRVLKQLALRQSRDATPTVVNIGFRDADALQQRGYRDFAPTKGGDRLTSGEPSRAWKICRAVSSVTLNAPSARAAPI